MDDIIRPRLLGRIKAKFMIRPHNLYYQLCVAGNDVFCFKCRLGICNREHTISKPSGAVYEHTLSYYHQTCFERLFQ